MVSVLFILTEFSLNIFQQRFSSADGFPSLFARTLLFLIESGDSCRQVFYSHGRRNTPLPQTIKVDENASLMNKLKGGHSYEPRYYPTTNC